MKYIPKSVTRLAGRSLLKLNGASPTILVVGGVVGLGATAIMAARATRNIDPILDFHAKERVHIDELPLTKKESQRELIKLYSGTALELGKLYAPTLLVGGISAGCVLGGHKILRGRHIATMAAYSGLMDQMKAYRGRVARTLGTEVEQAIFEGAHGEWVEDPDHKGEYKLEAKFDPSSNQSSYLRPWFDETSPNWTHHAESNRGFLVGTQTHLNNMLQIRGHVFLNEVLDDLRLPRTSEGAIMGWVRNSPDGDNFVDLGFMGAQVDPETRAFQAGETPRVRLNFNVDEKPIWDKISSFR